MTDQELIAQVPADGRRTSPRVVVVGGGITGLTVAHALRSRATVTVLEASDRVGGQIRTVRPPGFAELAVDVGAESIHLGAPHLAALVDELGLTDEVVSAEAGASLLLTPRGLRPLPAGVGPTGPTRLWPVLRSGALSPAGSLRAALEPLHARPRMGDLSVGSFVRERFGNQVAEVFVDPVLGNLHAGDIDRLSLRSIAPMLSPVADSGRSLLRRRSSGAGRPTFASWPQGLTRLTEELARQSQASIRLGAAVTSLRAEAGHWTAVTSSGELPADVVVLAVPAAAGAVLLDPHQPSAARTLRAIPHADVATIALAYPVAASHQFRGNGLLLPSGTGRTLKAATWLSRKWDRLRHDQLFVIRASAGRAREDTVASTDDDGLVHAITQDLREVAGVTAQPVASVVTRWSGCYPQLEVGHAGRIAEVRDQLTGTGIYLAGAPQDGLGLSATVRSALAVAASIEGA